MPHRPRPTLTDYVIAINPALIILLITSLVFFLLELMYQGQYPARLHYCLGWFVFGIVLISRISMEEGWERAAPFGAALAIVVALALNKFVSYEGTNLGEIGWMINYALMALIWWCAHQLTWDCTLIDEDQDASGEGLLQTVGLDSQASQPAKQYELKQSAPDSKLKPPPAAASQPPESKALLGSTITTAAAPEHKSWWRRFLERRRRPHAPGVWVVYFSLAALPLFGVGQAFIPAVNTDARQNAFLLLCVYVACGLGLLLTTSFLALRRYLRQRNLEMPMAMAGAWLTMGAVLIVALLFLTALLPRPEAEYSISELPGATSTEHESSQIAAGKEGTKDDQANSGSGERKHDDEESNNSKSGGKQPSRSTADQKSESNQSENAGKGAEKSEQGRAEDKNSDSKANDSKNAANASSSKSQRENEQSKQPGESHETPLQEINPQSVLSESVLSRVKYLFYGALGLFILYSSWRYRDELFAWLIALFSGFSWGKLFGARSNTAADKAIPVWHKSFFEYPDPFARGIAGRYSPEELVRYSFEAFEAWGRDNGWPRTEDQTANEFARQIGTLAKPLATQARALAELYSRVAYAPGTLLPASVEQLRTFWQLLAQNTRGL